MNIFDEITEMRGDVANIYAAYKEFPQSVEAHFRMNQQLLLLSGALPRAECEFLAYRTSQENSCEYCEFHHRKAYENYKSEAGSEREVLLARLAVTLTSSPSTSCLLKDEFLKAGFTNMEWLHAVNVVAYFNYSNRLALAMDIPLEVDYEKTCN
jgi:uncharacterized peroxidase-related enzyme